MGLGLLIFETGDAAASAALVTSEWFCGVLLVVVVSLCSLFDSWIEKKLRAILTKWTSCCVRMSWNPCSIFSAKIALVSCPDDFVSDLKFNM